MSRTALSQDAGVDIIRKVYATAVRNSFSGVQIYGFAPVQMKIDEAKPIDEGSCYDEIGRIVAACPGG